MKTIFQAQRKGGVVQMAMYKMRVTVYKDPVGKTLKGPTAVRFLGDLCSGVGLFGILGVILYFIEDFPVNVLVVFAVMAVAGFALCVVFHRLAKRAAERKCAEFLARSGGQNAAKKL